MADTSMDQLAAAIAMVQLGAAADPQKVEKSDTDSDQGSTRGVEVEAAELETERKPLEYDDGPLVWIDCEMTGLQTTDRIIEIAVIITDGQLNEVDEGIEFVIQTDKEVLDKMGEWCVKQHGSSGLTQACIDSPHTHEDVHQKVAEYIKKWIPERGAGVLAGSSVHADKAFLLREMPDITRHLSYRIVDVSSVKELCKRWFPSIEKLNKRQRGGIESSHRALDDIRGSIRELKFYREHMFIDPSQVPPMPVRRRSAKTPGADGELGFPESNERAKGKSEASLMIDKTNEPDL